MRSIKLLAAALAVFVPVTLAVSSGVASASTVKHHPNHHAVVKKHHPRPQASLPRHPVNGQPSVSQTEQDAVLCGLHFVPFAGQGLGVLGAVAGSVKVVKVGTDEIRVSHQLSTGEEEDIYYLVVGTVLDSSCLRLIQTGVDHVFQGGTAPGGGGVQVPLGGGTGVPGANNPTTPTTPTTNPNTTLTSPGTGTTPPFVSIGLGAR
jgi:hypothetical protein